MANIMAREPVPGLKLYKVARLDRVGVDEVHSFVIAAGDEESARHIAASMAMDEGRSLWLAENLAQVFYLGEAAEAGIVAGVICRAARAV